MADRILKLALWHTKTFTPIMTHEQLEPTMASLGFAPVPVPKNRCNSIVEHDGSVSSGTVWKEYTYAHASSFKRSSHPPRPKLPYPIIDGLHLCTYQAFLDCITFYLRFDHELSDIIHIRGMTLNRVRDRSVNWSRMEEGDNYKAKLYVYREGSYDISVYNSWKANENDVDSCSNKRKGYNPNIFYRGGNILDGCKFVRLENVVVQTLDNPKSRHYEEGGEVSSGKESEYLL